MIDPEVLKACGTTNERLREILTAIAPERSSAFSEDDYKRKERDVEFRKRIQDMVQNRLMEHINFAMQNHALYSSVDLAWDSSPINKMTYPLMLYAQGRIDLAACSNTLSGLPGSSEYITKDAKSGVVTSINIPRFVDVNVNLIRSVITRRIAAQSNKYQNLYPYYKYESRSTGQIGKLRADIMSQVADIMADQYDYRHHEVQVYRDMMMYGHCVDFPRCAWERELMWVADARSEEFTPPVGAEPPARLPMRSEVVREGVSFVNPHPTRVFWDNAYALSSLNTDTGCEYAGFWDVVRYGDVRDNTKYWNRDNISFSSNVVTLFSSYANYFSQYYGTIRPPCSGADLAGSNDLKNTLGIYSGDMKDTAMIVANYFWKMTPAEWGVGSYPHPIWVRLVTAGESTVIFAEIMPSRPCAVASYNENDGRRVNISIAHELMPYQDQMTNLLTYLLLCIQGANVKIMIINTDIVTDEEERKRLRKHATGESFFTDIGVVEISLAKISEPLPVGLGLDPSKAVQIVQTRDVSIDQVFRAISQLVQLVERLNALSPQEQGQPAPREISATETNLIAGTTESVYGFISDSADEYRAAKKRIVYESYMAMGDQKLRVPVMERYTDAVVKAAGFDIAPETVEVFADESQTNRVTVIGSKTKLLHDYIFTSRDGAERAINTQSAEILVRLVQLLQAPALAQAVGKEKLYEIVNEIFRLSGAAIDLKLQLKEGESNAIGIDVNQQVQQLLKQLTDEVAENAQAIAQVSQAQQAIQEAFSRMEQTLAGMASMRKAA